LKAKETIVLLHSNDIHSRLENAARIASVIEYERRLHGADRVAAVDCGDHMDRMRLETEGSDGEVNIRLLRQAGYEAVTIGNNEGLTYGAAALEKVYGTEAGLPVVCANMKRKASGRAPEWMQPSVILTKNGWKIGLIGATANFAEFYDLLGWEASEPLEAIRREAARLRGQADVIAVMSHLGLPKDKQMAEEIEGIHLILGAHTHHLLEEPLVIGGTTICAAGKFGEYVGRVEISWDEQARRPVFRGECVPTGAFPIHPDAGRLIDAFKESGRRRLDRVVASLPQPLPAGNGLYSPLGNLLAAGLRRRANAEIGIVNTGQLLGGLDGGAVTAGELHALCPSPINPCLMTIAGIHLREALEQSLLPEYAEKPIKGFGFRGAVLGSLSVDGMTIRYDASRPPMRRLVSVEINGEPLSDERLYTAGSIDMFSFKVGYESLANAESFRFYLPEFIRDVIASELQNPEALERCRMNRWKAGEA